MSARFRRPRHDHTTTLRQARQTRSRAGSRADELVNYEIKVSEGGMDVYGAFRVGTHDDLVTALGLAVQGDPRPRWRAW
jgi:hypothetical protein